LREEYIRIKGDSRKPLDLSYPKAILKDLLDDGMVLVDP